MTLNPMPISASVHIETSSATRSHPSRTFAPMAVDVAAIWTKMLP
jgi:hypothetical protein